MSIAIKKLIRINQKIIIARERSKNDWYDSVIQGIRASDFLIGMPYKKASPLILNKGDKVKLVVVAQSEKYQFNTTVTGRHFDNIPLFVLAMPTSFARIQMRKFVRLPIMLPVMYAEKKAQVKNPEYIKSHTLDISGGGLRFLSKKRYEPDTLLSFMITIPDFNNDEEIKVTGKVARSVNVPGAGYHISVDFTDIKVTVQEELVKYTIRETSRAKRMT